MSEGVLHHGRGLSRSSPLLAQVRSIWLPRDYVAPLCAVAGMAAASTVADPPPLWGSGVAWGFCYALLRCARSAEDVALGFDEDVSVSTSRCGRCASRTVCLRQERADRAAAPMLVGLEGTSAAAAVGWLVVALGRRGE